MYTIYRTASTDIRRKTHIMYSEAYNKAYEELSEFISNIKIVDSHEHLPAEADRLQRTLDFSLMFSHYCTTDLKTAGMPGSEMGEFLADNTPVDRKWEIFKPYYDLIHDGSYPHAARIAMKRFYDMDDVETLKDAEILTTAIRSANTEGLYSRVLRDACGIRTSMNFGGPASSDRLLHHVPFVDMYAEALFSTIRGLEDNHGISCSTLRGYETAMRASIDQMIANGAKGLKFAFAYLRDLYFAPVTYADAEKLYNRIGDEGHGWRDAVLGYEERRPLQDYLVHRICEIAAESGIPVIIHSAMQTDLFHSAEDARPLRLWNLPHRHRGTTFIILHSGFPWMEDGAMLAKHFPNVYLDMAWAHVMSPDITARALGPWVDLLPVNKVLGFGGDYSVVEKVYGHLMLARRSIVTALACKVELGDLSIARAKVWIQSIMHDNPARLYKV